MRPSPRAVSATFLFALPAGMAAAWVGLPLPWMIGPLLAVALLRVRGHGLASPRGGRQAGQWVIGVALGLHFTPQVLAQLGARAGLIMAIAASALLLGVLCAELTRRLSGADPVTAFFASLPGGASEMAVLAERYGGAVDLIAAAHALRLVVVVVAVPCALGLAGAQGSEFALRAPLEVEWSRLLALFAASLLGVGLLCAARIANAWILGPLLVVGALCAAGLPLSALPG